MIAEVCCENLGTNDAYSTLYSDKIAICSARTLCSGNISVSVIYLLMQNMFAQILAAENNKLLSQPVSKGQVLEA